MGHEQREPFELRGLVRVIRGEGNARMQTATGELARHIVTTRFGNLSPEVVLDAKRRVADLIAASLSGSTTPVRRRIKSFAQKNARAGTATIWGAIFNLDETEDLSDFTRLLKGQTSAGSPQAQRASTDNGQLNMTR